MSETGPAFPVTIPGPGTFYGHEVEEGKAALFHGLSKRELAAMMLKVPTSGTDWLDEMIKDALRTEIAAKAMQGQCVYEGMEGMDTEFVAGCACEVVDALLAMLAERGRK